MAKQAIKKKLSICNVIVAIICAISISAYLFMPFWKINLSYHVEKATLQTFFEKILTDDEKEAEGDAPTAMPMEETTEENTEETENIPSDLDFGKILKESIPEEGVDLSLSLKFESNEILSFLTKDATQSVEKLIDSNVTTLIEELSVPIEKISEGIVRETSKQTITNIIKEQVQQAFKEQTPEGEEHVEKTEDEVQQYLDNAGITNNYIEQKAEKITTILVNKEEKPSVNQIANEVIDIADDMMNKLANSGEDAFENRTLTEENKEEIKETVADALKTFTNSEGEVDISGLLSYGLSYLNKIPSSTPSPAPQANKGVSIDFVDESADSSPLESSDSSSPNTEEKEEATEKELEDALRDALMNLLNEKTIKTIASVMKIISYVLLFSIFTWAYLIVKILVKTFIAKNNAIKLGLPIWLGWLPYSVLYALPTALVNTLKNPPATLGADLVNNLKKLEGFSASFETGAWVAFACAIALFVFSFFYRKNRKKLKILLQAEKIEGKGSKKEEVKEELKEELKKELKEELKKEIKEEKK